MADSDIVRLTQGQIKMIGDKIKEAQESGGYKTLTSADEDFTIEGQTYINAVALPVGEYQVNNARIFFGYNNTKIEQESTLEAIRTYSGFLNRTTCWLSITGTNEMEEPSAYYEKQFRTITVIPRGELRLNYGNGVIDDANKTKLTDLAVIPVGFRNQEQQYPIVCFTSSGVVYEPVSGEFRLATSSEVEQALYQARLVMRGATSLANGASGRVPQPLIADRGKFLRGDGTWASAQADYEENDPNDSSYIQNRPFYEFERVVEERYEPDYVSWNTTNSLDNFTDAQIVKEYATANNIPTYGQAIFYVAVTGGTGTIQTGFPELGTIATSGDEFYWASQTIYDMDDTGYYLKDFSETSFEDFVSTTTGNTYRISSSTFTCNSSTGTLICLYQGDNDNCVFYLTLTSPSALFMYEGFSPDIIVRTTQSETKLLDSKFVNIDNESIINDSGVLKAVSEGGIKTLTTADYNWPQNNPSSIAPWLLSAGIYKFDGSVRLQTSNTASTTSTPGNGAILFVQKLSSNTLSVLTGDAGDNGSWGKIFKWKSSTGNAIFPEDMYIGPYNILVASMVKNSLTSDSSVSPLAAFQGKILNNKIGGDLSNLTTTDKTSLINAVNELVSDLDDVEPLSGSTAPTTSTAGTLGQTYVDTSTGDIYYLSEIDETTTPATYTWEKIATGEENGIVTLYAQQPDPVDLNELEAFIAGLENEKAGLLYIEARWHKVDSYSVSSTALSGSFVDTFFDTNKFRVRKLDFSINRQTGAFSGAVNYSTSIPTVVQTTGTSTTDVMSQKAVTSMVFADPGTNRNVVIGDTSSSSQTGVAIGYSAKATGTRAVAIGRNSTASGAGAIALGVYSSASSQGQMDIGSTNTGFGYNSSNYRLLTGLYDPQNDHDAATKGYVDGLVGNVESALNVINNGGSN